MTPFFILFMVEKESLCYKDVTDYIGDKEEPNNNHTPIRFPTKIQSHHLQYQSTPICKHRKNAPIRNLVTSCPPVCNPVTLSPRTTKKTHPI